MKNTNGNASVADFYRRVNGARNYAQQYKYLRATVAASQSDEFWPPADRYTGKRPDSDVVYQLQYGLKLGDGGDLNYHLGIINAADRMEVHLNGLPIGALERYTELRRALEDYIHRGGDWPTPNHMPGGSCLVAG